MKSSFSGLVWCLLFVVLDAAQAAFFGRTLQSLDSFLVGGLVFGSTAIVALLVSTFRYPDQMNIAFAHPIKLVVLNLSVAGAWACYLLALQRIEPAICFAIFAGLVPLTTIAMHLLGVAAASGVATR